MFKSGLSLAQSLTSSLLSALNTQTERQTMKDIRVRNFSLVNWASLSSALSGSCGLDSHSSAFLSCSLCSTRFSLVQRWLSKNPALPAIIEFVVSCGQTLPRGIAPACPIIAISYTQFMGSSISFCCSLVPKPSKLSHGDIL